MVACLSALDRVLEKEGPASVLTEDLSGKVGKKG